MSDDFWREMPPPHFDDTLIEVRAVCGHMRRIRLPTMGGPPRNLAYLEAHFAEGLCSTCQRREREENR